MVGHHWGGSENESLASRHEVENIHAKGSSMIDAAQEQRDDDGPIDQAAPREVGARAVGSIVARRRGHW